MKLCKICYPHEHKSLKWSKIIFNHLYVFILFMGFSRQEYWSGLPSPSPVDHDLSELSTMTCPFWVALHSFIELDKAVVHVIRLVSFLWLWFSFCLPLMEKDKKFMEASWWERLTEGETGSCSDGAMLSKSLIQFSADGWSYVPSLLFTWGQTMAEGFLSGSDSKASACNVGDQGSIPGSGRSPGEGNGSSL